MKVIFRKYENGSVCALFPEVSEHANPAYCGYYGAVDNNSDGPVSCHYQRTMDSTRPTSAKEHRALLKLLHKTFDFEFQLIQLASLVMSARRTEAAKQYRHSSDRTWTTCG